MRAVRGTWYFATSRPMLIFRVPFPTPPWKNVLKAMTPVMREYGYKRKDIQLAELLPFPIEGEWTDDADHFSNRLDAAFSKGSSILSEFDLFEWRRGKFIAVRQEFTK